MKFLQRCLVVGVMCAALCPQQAHAFVHLVLPPTPVTHPIAGVPQGALLAVSAPAEITTLTFLGGTYVRGRTHDRYDFVLPVGMRQEIGTFTLRANNGHSWLVRCTPGGWLEQILTLPTDEKVNLSEADLARVDRENVRIGSVFQRRSTQQSALAFVHPLATEPTGSRFGSRRVINGVAKQRHTGADYSASRGTPVRSSEAGTVALAEEHFFAGNSVFVDHGDGWVSMYFHLDAIEVKAGQQVARGQTIGTVGASGRATGPHLHLGFRYQGAILDPADVFNLFHSGQ